MARVYITTNDPIVSIVMSEQECNDLFGDDYILDYGIDIPDSLLARYKENYIEFWKIQDEIKALPSL